MNTKVKLNEKAGVFYDPSTGICIRRGQVVELSSTQMLAPRIARALRGGHLVTAIESTKEVTPLSGSELREKFESLYNQGMTVSKVSKNFSMEELKAVGLDVPQATELAWLLRQDGYNLPDDILFEEECVQAIEKLLEEHHVSH